MAKDEDWEEGSQRELESVPEQVLLPIHSAPMLLLIHAWGSAPVARER